ncbi:MAG TPA: class I SAM-dependent methyltransferase [Chryseolinea sp.]
MNNFDFIAPFYDRLSKLIFGKAIISAQTAYLTDIRQGGNVLILGGGTGWILRAVTAINPTCRIWYIDASSKMIALSKQAAAGSQNPVIFIHGTENSIPDSVSFDAVITNFYLDLFLPASCDDAIKRIRVHIHSGTVWLVSDFIDTTWWHGAMLRVMYAFFRTVSGIKTGRLCNWERLLQQNGLQEDRSTRFYGGFIKSAAFRLRA